MKKKLHLGLAVTILAAAIPALAGRRKSAANPARSRAIPAGEIGSRMPDFSAKDLQGREISSSDLRGKVVLVDFWATWCQPCKKEMPGYEKLRERYGKDGLAVVGFKFNTMADEINPLEFARQIGVRYPLIVATESIREKFGGIKGLPTTMIYDRQGILRYKVIGFEYTAAIEWELKLLL